MPDETLTITFTYSTTTGVFTGHFANGTTFQFIAAADSPLPVKMRNALQALMAKAHTAFKSSAHKPEMTDEEWEEMTAKIAEFEARHGVTRAKPRGRKAAPRAVKVTSISLEDLGI